MSFKAKSEYFRSLCNKSRLIAHGREVNGGMRQAFFRMNNEDEFMAGVSNWIHFPCVVQVGMAGRFTSDKKSISKLKLVHELYFLEKASSPLDMDDIETAFDGAMQAMKEFISGIYNDYANGCSIIDDLDLSRFSFNPVGPIGSGVVGWQLLFEDSSYADDITFYDPSKWFE